MREFTEILKMFVLPESPPSYIMAIFLLSVVSLAFAGLETLARYAKLLIYLLGAGFIIVSFVINSKISGSDCSQYWEEALINDYKWDSPVLFLWRCSAFRHHCSIFTGNKRN